MEPIVDIDITGPDVGMLTELTRVLVEERLVACGSVSGGVRSLYRWKGEIRDEPEAITTLHTRESLVSYVYARVAAVHPYEVPGYRWRRMAASPAYAEWVVAETVSPLDLIEAKPET